MRPLLCLALVLASCNDDPGTSGSTGSTTTGGGGAEATSAGVTTTTSTSSGGEIDCDITPPGPLPGWEREFDGITCVHPPVEADCTNGWCRIPAGCFIKGSPEDEPGRALYPEEQRAVTLTRRFWIQQHELTQEEWVALGLTNPSGPFLAEPGGDCTDDPKCPVGHVNWWEALAFANLRSQAHSPPLDPCYVLNGCSGAVGEGMVCESATVAAPSVYECDGYRLPTDAEFEYAIRAGTTTAFYFGDFGPDVPTGLDQCDPYEPLVCHAWYCGNTGGLTRPVGRRRPNGWHLYDMAGNAREWVYDTYTGAPPPPGPLADPEGPTQDDPRRRTRAGSAIGWPTLLRSASGLGPSGNSSSATYGFRLVRTDPADPERAAEGP